MGVDNEGADGIVVYSLDGGASVIVATLDTSSVSTSSQYTAIAVSNSASSQRFFFTGIYYRVYVYTFTSSMVTAYAASWSPTNTELNSMDFGSWVTNTW